MPGPLHYEAQVGLQCGKHAINHLLGEEKVVHVAGNRHRFVRRTPEGGFEAVPGATHARDPGVLVNMHGVCGRKPARVAQYEAGGRRMLFEGFCDETRSGKTKELAFGENFSLDMLQYVLRKLLGYEVQALEVPVNLRGAEADLQWQPRGELCELMQNAADGEAAQGKRGLLGVLNKLGTTRGHYTVYSHVAVPDTTPAGKFAYIDSAGTGAAKCAHDAQGGCRHVHYKSIEEAVLYPRGVHAWLCVYDTPWAYESRAVRALRAGAGSADWPDTPCPQARAAAPPATKRKPAPAPAPAPASQAGGSRAPTRRRHPHRRSTTAKVQRP